DSDGAAIPGWSQRRAALWTANPAGPYLVNALVANESGGPSNFVTYAGVDDSLRLLIHHGGQAPGTPAGTNFTSSSAFTLPRINSSGAVVIGSKLEGGDTKEALNDTGIWLSDAGQLDLLYRQGDLIPGDAAGKRFGPLPTNFLSGISLNDMGDVAFTSGVLNNPNANVVFVRRESQLERVAEAYQIAPGTSSALFNNQDFRSLAINAAGHVAFSGGAFGGDADLPRSTGIWAETSDGDVELIAIDGQRAPGTDDGTFDVFGVQFQFNARNQVAFAADYWVDAEPRHGVFAFDVDHELKPILLPGDEVSIGVGDIRVVSRADFLSRTGGNQDGLASSFNESGQLLLRAEFTDGSFGMLVSNHVAVPEPVGISMLTIILMATAGRRTIASSAKFAATVISSP
ncbi:MAG: hypothetical protein KDA92_26105, partial [Planctomycetales bacterium]|nr:hypothetical protein [Planctomycetales bacterium]